MVKEKDKKIQKEEETGDGVEETAAPEEGVVEEDPKGEEPVETEIEEPQESSEELEKTEDVAVNEEAEDELVEENISEEIEVEEGAETPPAVEEIPDFRVGDTIRVNYKIIEGDKIRTQPYQGIVIARKGSGTSKTFTVRKIGADSVGVERIFPLFSPNIEKIKVVKRGKVRRAKLYYLRDRVGRKATRIREKVSVNE